MYEQSSPEGATIPNARRYAFGCLTREPYAAVSRIQAHKDVFMARSQVNWRGAHVGIGRGSQSPAMAGSDMEFGC